MQQHPIIHYLRYVGFALGATLFVFMLYRSSQMLSNPVYVKGKPSVQWLAVANPKSTQTYTGAIATAATTMDTSTTNTASSEPAPSPARGSEVTQATSNETGPNEAAANPATSHTPNGKALGKVKHAD
jgi:hypothetical protein